MPESQSCAELVAGALTWLQIFLKSNGPLLFAAIAAARWTVYYCGHSRYPEVRELNSVLITASLLGLLIIATETQLPVLVKQALSCKNHGTQVRVLARKDLIEAKQPVFKTIP